MAMMDYNNGTKQFEPRRRWRAREKLGINRKNLEHPVVLMVFFVDIPWG